jgi:cyclomaltodextrinase
MDFIFGTFATDELKVVHHRMARRGLQHTHEISPRDPQPGQAVTVTAQVGTDLSADHVACYYTLDGSQPEGGRGVATRGQVLPLHKIDVVWDAVAWGYVTRWQGTLPPQPDGTVVRYRISAWTDSGPEVFADWPQVQVMAELAAAAFFRKKPLPETPPDDPARGQTFSYHVDQLRPPDWARAAVIYQVFVDRFYPGDGRAWLQPDDLKGFFGGTLWGVRDRLEYIADLGATCIWLSPTWVSSSHHGYDVTDYTRTEPRLGGDEALHRLVEAAHARGVRVLLDMVCNHISNEHPIFQDAYANPTSPYRDWFIFDDSTIGYRSFFGVRSMPQVNVANPAARQWLIDVARYWLREFDVDGYRLDYANGPGPEFWSDFRAGCRAEKPDCFCFGELVDQPMAILPYIGRLDGCLDFHVGEAIRKTFAYRTWTEADFERFLQRHEEYFGREGDFIQPTFIDNHDMDRFLYAAGGDKDALRRAAAAQMRLPGPPIIYYGTEVGLSQRKSKGDGLGLEASREPMAWGGAQDRDLLAYYQSLIRQRRETQS